MKWQTMETAPRNRPILAWCRENRDTPVLCAVVQWCDCDEWGVWAVVPVDDGPDVYPFAWLELPASPDPTDFLLEDK